MYRIWCYSKLSGNYSLLHGCSRAFSYSSCALPWAVWFILFLLLKRKSVVRITTGSQALDKLLGGSIYSPLIMLWSVVALCCSNLFSFFKFSRRDWNTLHHRGIGEFRCVDVLVPFDSFSWITTADWLYQWNVAISV